MKKYEQLKDELTSLKLQYPNAFFPSESEREIFIVSRGWWQIPPGFIWKREKDGYEERLLNGAVDTATESIPLLDESIKTAKNKKEADFFRKIQRGYKGLKAISELMLKQDKLVAIRRTTSEQSVFDIYILAYFGGRYIGIRSKLVETS